MVGIDNYLILSSIYHQLTNIYNTLMLATALALILILHSASSYRYDPCAWQTMLVDLFAECSIIILYYSRGGEA